MSRREASQAAFGRSVWWETSEADERQIRNARIKHLLCRFGIGVDIELGIWSDVARHVIRPAHNDHAFQPLCQRRLDIERDREIRQWPGANQDQLARSLAGELYDRRWTLEWVSSRELEQIGAAQTRGAMDMRRVDVRFHERSAGAAMHRNFVGAHPIEHCQRICRREFRVDIARQRRDRDDIGNRPKTARPSASASSTPVSTSSRSRTRRSFTNGTPRKCPAGAWLPLRSRARPAGFR